MTSVLKKESSVLDEFEIPEHLGSLVEDLKKEQTVLKDEIDKARAKPVVRKVDESTRVFNLRQHQMELKLAELEEKKVKSEKELQQILQEKNSSLHADLRKLAQYLLQETRKIDAKMSSVLTLKNELQRFFEQGLEERKKTHSEITEQTLLIRETGELVRASTKKLREEFDRSTQALSGIQKEILEERRKLALVREETHGLTLKKEELQKINETITHRKLDAEALTKVSTELQLARSQWTTTLEDKAKVTQEVDRLQHELLTHCETLERLKLEERNLSEAIQGKRNLLSRIEEDAAHARKTLEEKRTQIEASGEELRTEKTKLLEIQRETTTLIGKRQGLEASIEESQRLYETREELHGSRIAEKEAQWELRKTQWEVEFQQYCDSRKADLARDLTLQDKEDQDRIRKKKKELLTGIVQSAAFILGSPDFASTEERTLRIKKDAEASFDEVFGKTRRWRLW